MKFWTRDTARSDNHQPIEGKIRYLGKLAVCLAVLAYSSVCARRFGIGN